MWSGEVLLRDLQLRTAALDALPIPVKAIGGTVGEVRVTVPWHRLGKEPLIISIDRVFLLVGPRADTEGYCEPEEKEMAERTKRDALAAWEAVQDNKEQSEERRREYKKRSREGERIGKQRRKKSEWKKEEPRANGQKRD